MRGYYAGAIYADGNATVEILSSSFWDNEYKFAYVGYGNDISAVGSATVTISTAEGEAAPCSSSGLPTTTPNVASNLGTCPGHSRAPPPSKIGPDTPRIDRKLPAGAIAAIVVAAVVVVIVIAITVAVFVYQVVKRKQGKKSQDTGTNEPKRAGVEMESVQ